MSPELEESVARAVFLLAGSVLWLLGARLFVHSGLTRAKKIGVPKTVFRPCSPGRRFFPGSVCRADSGVRRRAGLRAIHRRPLHLWTEQQGTAATDTGGNANFSSKRGRGTYKLMVTNTSKTGYTFDAATCMLSKSVTK